MDKFNAAAWFRTRPLAGDAVVGLLIAAFVVGICHGAQIQLGFIDTWVYTGYIFGFRELAEEFGVTYYSLRLAWLVPAILFDRVFGLQTGFLLLRAAMIVALFVSLARVGRAFVPAGTARLFAALAVLHPWVWRSLFWNYSDGMGLTYAAAVFAIAMVLTDSPRRPGRLAAAGGAGALLALAANCNLFLLAVAGAAGLWPVARFAGARRWRELAEAALAAMGGFAAAYGGLVVARYLLAPVNGWQVDIFGVKTGASMVSGVAAAWHQNAWTVFFVEQSYFLIVPGVVLGAVALAAAFTSRERRGPVVLAGVILLVTVGGYVVTDFGFQAAVITLPFYFVYLVPATFLALAATVGAVLSAQKRTADVLGAMVAAWVVVLGAYLGREVINTGSQSLPLAVVSGTLLILFAAVLIIGRRLAAGWVTGGVAVVAIGSQVLFFGGNDFYAPVSQTRGRTEAAVYALGRDLWPTFAMRSAEDGSIGFWYTNSDREDIPMAFDGLNGLWLWGYSRLHGGHQGDAGGTPGMPELTSYEEERVQRYSEVAVLAWDRSEAERGVAQLAALGRTAPATYREFERGDLRIVTALVGFPDHVRQPTKTERKALREQRRAAREAKGATKEPEKLPQ